MKTVVSLQDLLDGEIRPQALIAEYQGLVDRDLRQWWAAHPLRAVPCPACQSDRSTPAFERFGARYCQCEGCASLFVSPRPDEAALVEFYRDAPAAKFWRERIWPTTAATRREKLARPRAEWVNEGLAEYAPKAVSGLDISPYGGAVAEELARAGRPMMAAAWLADLDIPSPVDGVTVRPSLITGLSAIGPRDFVTAFDVLDRAADVPALMAAVAEVLPPGGLLFLTATNADGFDLQVLWSKAPTLAPPDKLNVLSVDGLLKLLSGPEWEVLEFSTPGLFDVEQVRRAVAADPTGDWPRPVRRLLARGGGALDDFQEFLQRHRLASFARLVVRRR